MLRALKEQGTPPDMVQIGNEISHGMLWPDGKPWEGGDWPTFANLVKAGAKAARQVEPDALAEGRERLGAPAPRAQQEPEVVPELQVARRLREPAAAFALSGQQAMSLVRQRDHAALLVGFFGALRRSELCALKISDITFTKDSGRDVAYVNIAQSKTDQEGIGQRVQLQRSDKAPAHMAVLDVLSSWIATLSALGCKQNDPLFPVLNAALDAPKRAGKNRTAKGMDPEQWSQRLNALAFESEALGEHTKLTAVQDEQARERFPEGWKAPLPYMRIVAQPA